MKKWIGLAPSNANVVIGCVGEVTHHEVRDFATKWLGLSEHAQALPTEPTAVEDVQIRWIGDDYIHGGSPNRRRLQVSTRERQFQDWRDV